MARFTAKVLYTDTCHLWQASKTNNGYGRFCVRHGSTVVAHKWLWEQVHGPIPDGLQLDHVKDRGCHSKHCVNLLHLELVTPKENRQRAHNSRCPENHLKTKVNSEGYLVCVECHRESVRRHRARKAVA